jgi:hypothetical protein
MTIKPKGFAQGTLQVVKPSKEEIELAAFRFLEAASEFYAVKGAITELLFNLTGHWIGEGNGNFMLINQATGQVLDFSTSGAAWEALINLAKEKVGK